MRRGTQRLLAFTCIVPLLGVAVRGRMVLDQRAIASLPGRGSRVQAGERTDKGGEQPVGALEVVVVLASAVLIAALGWYFFGPRRAGAARLEGGVQRVEVTVRGGYSPDLIKVRQGMPVEVVFDRQEAGECTSRVVFPDLKVGAGLPAHTRTTVRLNPDRPGSFGFDCGMNMIHGTLLVEPAEGSVPPAPDGHGATAVPPLVPPVATGGPSAGEERTAAESEAADAAERQAEIKDLTRRVLVGAVLTAPVLFARRTRHADAVEGMPAVVAALQRAQAGALLLNTPVDLPSRLWEGSEPTQIALSSAELESFGVLGFQEEPPGAALIRALVRTGAELVVVSREELPLEDGVGVLLRYTDPGVPL
ncbi:cupredoxin domain-containing protein [Streptomyces sp. NPDC017958]|uniref:cupredoxin domain-containing protein n=1 Tax=Streptomyces sp. NPDC017958 TaxID=3365021 RepID=UPI003798DC14